MRFIGGLQKLDGFCGKFDEELWTALLDYATVYARDDIRFTFKAGNEVKVDGQVKMCKFRYLIQKEKFFMGRNNQFPARIFQVQGGAFRGCIVELYQFRCTDEHRNTEIDTMQNC